MCFCACVVFFFKQKTAYERRISDWSSDVCSSDLLVVVSSGTLDPHAVEEVMDNALKSHHHHSLKPAEGLQSLADALPALGIVAAVLGVVKTMGSIDQPPAILGAMIGSALVGTFLGVLLAYRSEEHTSELQSLMRISYAVFCLK